MPLERDGEFVMLVRRGQMTPEAVSEINKHLEHIVGNGLWEQRWDGPCAPPRPEGGARSSTSTRSSC